MVGRCARKVIEKRGTENMRLTTGKATSGNTWPRIVKQPNPTIVRRAVNAKATPNTACNAADARWMTSIFYFQSCTVVRAEFAVFRLEKKHCVAEQKGSAGPKRRQSKFALGSLARPLFNNGSACFLQVFNFTGHEIL